jgi:multimeric flavodoxin WrbA
MGCGEEVGMEVVAICASPRSKGNTATLVEALLKGAREAGAATTRFDPSKMKICDCDACRACLESAETRCICDDDMQQIYDALLRADAWVFASPVYFWHVSAPMKRVIDRLYACYTEEGGWRLGLEGTRKGAVIVVQADPDQETPAGVAKYLAQVMTDLRVESIGSMVGPSLGDLGDAEKHPELLEQARELGKKLVLG